MTRSGRAAYVLLALTILPAAARAQAALPSLPRGSHDFAVHGTYEGDAMDPWQALLQLRDSTLDGRPALLLHYRTRLQGNQYRYNYFVLWRPEDLSTLRAQWHSSGHPDVASEPGRSASRCDVVVAGDSIRVTTDTGAQQSHKVDIAAVPEFALATVLAARPLAEGDTVRYHAFRCAPSPDAPRLLYVFDFTGLVRSVSLRRNADMPPEPVWLIEGVGSYAFKAWIARQDRQVLQVILPQGYSGWMTETYMVTRAK